MVSDIALWLQFIGIVLDIRGVLLMANPSSLPTKKVFLTLFYALRKSRKAIGLANILALLEEYPDESEEGRKKRIQKNGIAYFNFLRGLSFVGLGFVLQVIGLFFVII